GEEFGWTVAVGTDRVAITAILADGAQANTGAVYVFSRNGTTWTEQTKLTAGDGTTDDGFGWSLHLSEDGETLVAGSIAAPDAQQFPRGAGYVFTRSGGTWSPQAKLTTADGGTIFLGDE